MGKRVCEICDGRLYINSGRYENCYSCGGRGYGAATDIPCTGCGGQGTSSTEIQDLCWNCNGEGTVTTPEYATTSPSHKGTSASKTASSKDNTSVKNSQSTKNTKASKKTTVKDVSDTIAGIAMLIAIGIAIFYYNQYPENDDVGEALGVGLVSGIFSFVVLFVSYYLLKLAIGILKVVFILLFYGAIITGIAYKMDAQWAIDIVDSFNNASSTTEYSAPKQPMFYITCLTNSLGHDVSYSYKWNSEQQWSTQKLKPGESFWHSGATKQEFSVQFDTSYASGFQEIEYSLEQRYGAQVCSSAKQYFFKLNNNKIELFY